MLKQNILKINLNCIDGFTFSLLYLLQFLLSVYLIGWPRQTLFSCRTGLWRSWPIRASARDPVCSPAALDLWPCDPADMSLPSTAAAAGTGAVDVSLRADLRVRAQHARGRPAHTSVLGISAHAIILRQQGQVQRALKRSFQLSFLFLIINKKDKLSLE